jgi:hypothetical protein
MKDKLIRLLIESVDVKGLAVGLIDEIIEEALNKVVADSSNKIDDMIMATLWPVLEIEIKKLIEDKLDLKKILKLEEEA